MRTTSTRWQMMYRASGQSTALYAVTTCTNAPCVTKSACACAKDRNTGMPVRASNLLCASKEPAPLVQNLRYANLAVFYRKACLSAQNVHALNRKLLIITGPPIAETHYLCNKNCQCCKDRYIAYHCSQQRAWEKLQLFQYTQSTFTQSSFVTTMVLTMIFISLRATFGISSNLLHGEMIMADRGFNISQALASNGATL